MRANSLAMVLISVAVLLVGSAVAQERGTESPSGTHEASCIVRISSNPRVLPINDELIRTLLASTPVIGEPAREILGSKSEPYEEDLKISFELLREYESDEQNMLVGNICVRVDEGCRPAADKFLFNMCQRLERALARVGEVDERRMRERLHEVEEELARAQAQFEELRAARRDLCEQAGRADLSRERIEDTIHELEEHKAELELKLAGSAAREAALTEQIAKLSEQAREAAEHDAVMAELKKVVELREQEVTRLQVLAEKGQASSKDLRVAQEPLAVARAELARRREEIGERMSGGMLVQLNKELVELSIQTAELEAALGHVQERLGEIRENDLLELADRYEREFEIPLDMARNALQQLAMDRYFLRDQLRNLRHPEVLVIGGE